VPVELGSRAFDLLLALVRRKGRLATKNELMAEVWPRTVVEENNLQAHVSALRKVLARDAGGQGYLLTVPGHGYRFVAEVTRESASSDSIENPSRPVAQAADTPAIDGAPERRPELPLPERPSIAVMPFANLRGDPDQEHVADGLCEDLITGLARIRWLFVIARNSTFIYKSTAIDIRRVSRELGVRYVLEGSVRRAGSRLRITAQLIDATTLAHHWAERYDRELGDIFAVQDEITRSVAAAIEPRLLAAEGVRALA
jgi:TolB-like protein